MPPINDWTNKSLLEKAAILTSTGGQLNPQQFKKFLSTVVDQSDFLKQIHVQPMQSSEYQMDIVDIAPRQMREAGEDNTDMTTANATITRRSLQTKKVKLFYDISADFLEENIEQEEAEQTLNEKFAAAFRNDLLDLAFNGDTATPNTDPDYDFLKIMDGWLKIASGDSSVHVVNYTGADYKAIFNQLLQALPKKWKTNPQEFAIIVSPTVEEGYKDQLGARQTALGDAYLTENRTARFKGYDVLGLPYMPDNRIILTKKKNLWTGVGREMKVYKQFNPRRDMFEFTIYAKVAYNYALSDMVVLGVGA